MDLLTKNKNDLASFGLFYPHRFATWGLEVKCFKRVKGAGESFSLLYFYSECVLYHWLFSSVCLWRAVHWLFEVASKKKWGRKSIIDFAFCLTQTLRTEKHIRS